MQANELDEVDSRASTLIVSLVMKLSEVELRPLFLHLCEWKAAISAEDDEATLARLDRRISFYKVLNNLAGTLKVKTPSSHNRASRWAVPRKMLSLCLSPSHPPSTVAADQLRRSSRAYSHHTSLM